MSTWIGTTKAKPYSSVADEIKDLGPKPYGIEFYPPEIQILTRHVEDLKRDPLKVSHTFTTDGAETYPHGSKSPPWRVVLGGFENALTVQVLSFDDKNVTVKSVKNAVVEVLVYT